MMLQGCNFKSLNSHYRRTQCIRLLSNTFAVRDKFFVLTVHSKNVTGLDPMAWRLSPSTLDEGRQTRSPLVPYKLPRLLPHKGTVPGRSRDSPSWTQLLTVNSLPPGRDGIRRRQEHFSLAQSVLSWSVGDGGHLCRSVLLQYVSVYHALMDPECFRGQRKALQSNLEGVNKQESLMI